MSENKAEEPNKTGGKEVSFDELSYSNMMFNRGNDESAGEEGHPYSAGST